MGILALNEIANRDVFDLLGVTEEEVEDKYNQLVEASEWMKEFKDKYLDWVLANGLEPGGYSVHLKTKYVDYQVVYPMQKPTRIIDNDRMKNTTIQVEEVDAETGEVITRKVNAYDYFNTKPKAAPKPYVKEIKNDR